MRDRSIAEVPCLVSFVPFLQYAQEKTLCYWEGTGFAVFYITHTRYNWGQLMLRIVAIKVVQRCMPNWEFGDFLVGWAQY